MRVAIAGAGIGGLCLAQGLRKHGIEVAVYERDLALDTRGQGYRLHIDAVCALRACLPPDLFELVVATSGIPGTDVTVVTRRLRRVHQKTFPVPGDQRNPATFSAAVDRQRFREILAARLGGAIEYGRACVAFEQDDDAVRIRFGDGSVAEADVLVGADGVTSRVRKQYLPHASVPETGSLCVYGRTPLTAQSRPLIPECTWRGFTAVIGFGIGMATGVVDFREPPPVAAARIAPDVKLSAATGYWMWALTGPAARFAGDPRGAGPDQLHAIATRTIRRWHRDLRNLVGLAAVDQTILVPVRSAAPVRSWPASRVTLLGDAIHAMSPAGGSGANTALRDAALLAGELAAAARGDKPAVRAIADYEREMIRYGLAAVRAAERVSRTI